jgi:pseudouridine kinase
VLMKHEAAMSNAACIVMDLNCPKETVESIKELALVRHIPFALIPVSSPKMNRMPENLQGVTWFICNRDEAATYLSSTITSEEDWKKAVQALLDKGAENVVITAGSKGVYAASKEVAVKNYAAIQINGVEDVTGAGDAFVGALLHSWIRQEPFAESIQNGLMNAAKTLQCAFTVRPDLSANKLKKELEE